MRIPAGPVELGPATVGELPYIVLLYGGDLECNQLPWRQDGLRSTLRRSDRRFSRPRSLGRGLSHRDGWNHSSHYLQAGIEGSGLRRAVTAGADPGAGSAERKEIETYGGVGNFIVDGDGEISWQLKPRYSLGEAGRAMRSINTRADREAGKAASTVLKVAALSSVAGDVEDGGGTKGTVQPRLRYAVHVSVQEGVFLQMEDVHRLENTSNDQRADPTLELAFMVHIPRQGDGTSTAKTTSVPAGIYSLDEAEDRVEKKSSKDAGAVTGLIAMFDFEHVASCDLLGEQDSLSMHAAFGMEGKYFNPRVQRSEHFLEPWR